MGVAMLLCAPQTQARTVDPDPKMIAGVDEAHDFHVGLMEIAYNEVSRTYQISMKLFTDDLDHALEPMKSSGEDFDLDSLTAGYILDHLRLSSAEAGPLSMTYIGQERAPDATWIYLESETTEELRALEVWNTALMELNADQKHFIHLLEDGKRAMTRTTEIDRKTAVFP